MITKVFFDNGAVAEWLAGEFTEYNQQMVLYNGKKYGFIEHPMTVEPFILVGSKSLWLEGSYDLIGEREVKLYWRDKAEHDLAEKAAKSILADYPQTELLSFGAHEHIVFTEDKKSFKVSAPNGNGEYRGTLDEVRLFVHKNY